MRNSGCVLADVFNDHMDSIRKFNGTYGPIMAIKSNIYTFCSENVDYMLITRNTMQETNDNAPAQA